MVDVEEEEAQGARARIGGEHVVHALPQVGPVHETREAVGLGEELLLLQHRRARDHDGGDQRDRAPDLAPVRNRALAGADQDHADRAARVRDGHAEREALLRAAAGEVGSAHDTALVAHVLGRVGELFHRRPPDHALARLDAVAYPVLALSPHGGRHEPVAAGAVEDAVEGLEDLLHELEGLLGDLAQLARRREALGDLGDLDERALELAAARLGVLEPRAELLGGGPLLLHRLLRPRERLLHLAQPPRAPRGRHAVAERPRERRDHHEVDHELERREQALGLSQTDAGPRHPRGLRGLIDRTRGRLNPQNGEKRITARRRRGSRRSTTLAPCTTPARRWDPPWHSSSGSPPPRREPSPARNGRGSHPMRSSCASASSSTAPRASRTPRASRWTGAPSAAAWRRASARSTTPSTTPAGRASRRTSTRSTASSATTSRPARTDRSPVGRRRLRRPPAPAPRRVRGGTPDPDRPP